MGGDVRRRRVGDDPEVEERQLGRQLGGVVGVEGGPAPVLALHADEPVDGATAGALPVGAAGPPAQGDDDFSGVVDVGVMDVLELESPAAGCQPRPPD